MESKQNVRPVNSSSIKECVESEVLSKFATSVGKKINDSIWPIPSGIAASNFWEAGDSSYQKKWIPVIYSFGQRESWGSLELFRHRDSPEFNVMDFKLFCFFIKKVFNNPGCCNIGSATRVDRSLNIEFTFSEIIKFCGKDKSGKMRERISNSIDKLKTIRFRLKKSFDDGRIYVWESAIISDVGRGLRKTSKESIRVICRVNEWVLLSCFSSIGYVDMNIFNVVSKNRLAWLLLLSVRSYRRKTSFVDKTDRLYLAYRKKGETRAYFMIRLRSAIKILMKVGVVEKFVEDTKNKTIEIKFYDKQPSQRKSVN